MTKLSDDLQPNYDHAPTMKPSEMAKPVDQAALYCSTCGKGLMYLTGADEWVHIPTQQWVSEGQLADRFGLVPTTTFDPIDYSNVYTLPWAVVVPLLRRLEAAEQRLTE